MSEFSVSFYTKRDGSEPAKEFLLDLSKGLRAKTLRNIELLSEYGFQLREPFSKPLGDGIFELRTQLGSDTTRILYFFFFGGRIILTNGFVKKTQKTPADEIELAKKYRADYIAREGKTE